ncbi:uncharacterized protein isoform X2 [Rhodnius prolixus]|uniref:uncharacterized protein isoform X2 n=1 Tax=Rhodnius prolixus TaxID=13249 RepID=UPI003D18DCE9
MEEIKMSGSRTVDTVEEAKSDSTEVKKDDNLSKTSDSKVSTVEVTRHFHFVDDEEEAEEEASLELKEKPESPIMDEDPLVDQDLLYLLENLPQEPVVEDLVIRAGNCIEDIQKLPESIVPSNLVETFTELIETIILHRKAHDLCTARSRKQKETLITQEKCIDELKEQLKQTQQAVAERNYIIEGYEQKIDTFHLRENKLQEELEIQSAEVKHLHEEMQRRDEIQADIEEEIGTSGRAREAYARQKQKLKEQMDAVERTLAEMKEERDKVIDLYKSSVLQIEDLRKEITAKNELLIQREKLLAKVDNERSDLRKAIVNSNKIFKLVQKSFLHFEKHMMKLEEANFAQAAQIDGLLRKTTDVFRQNIYYADEGAKCKREMSELQQSYDQMFRYLQNQEVKLRDQLLKARDLERSLAILDRKFSKTLYEKKKAVSDRDKIINQHISYEKSLKQKDEIIERSRLKINSLTVQHHRFQRMIKELKDHKAEALKKVDESFSKLSVEKSEQVIQIEEIDKLKSDLEKSKMVRQRLLSDNTILMRKIAESVEEIRITKAETYNAKKQIVQMDHDHNIFLGKYGELMEEKNVLSAKYMECKLKLTNQESKVRLSEWQIEHLKEEMRLKDRIFKNKDIENKKFYFAKRKIEVNYKTLHRNYSELKQKTGGENKDLIMLQLEMKKCLRRTKDLEGQAEKDKVEIGTLKTQLDRRVAEIAILNEKVEVLSSLLSRGEAQYNQRIEDIRLLKIEVQKLRREKNILVKEFQNNADLRSEMYFLHKDLSEERQRSKALQEQLESPLNYHRWRLLEGTDPTKKDMLDKLLMLRKKSYLAAKELAMQKSKFEDLQLLYNTLKHKYEMMPTQEELARFGETKLLYRKKCEEYKVLESHVIALEREQRDYKTNIADVKKELTEMKKLYYDLKSKENKRKLNMNGNTLPKLRPVAACVK